MHPAAEQVERKRERPIGTFSRSVYFSRSPEQNNVHCYIITSDYILRHEKLTKNERPVYDAACKDE